MAAGGPTEKTEIVELGQETAKLRLEKENTELRAQIAAFSKDSDVVVKLERDAAKLRLEKENAELRAQIRAFSTDPDALRLEQAAVRLRLENENSELSTKIAERAERAEPWWRKSSTVTMLTAILAAILPLTTLVQGCVQKNREIALEVQKQDNAISLEREKQTEQIRTAYLERLKVPGEHLRVLRFVIAMTKDEDLRGWAVSEKKQLEDQLKALQVVLDKREDEAAISQKTYVDALQAVSKGDVKSDPQQLNAKRANYLLVKGEVDDARRAREMLLSATTSACVSVRNAMQTDTATQLLYFRSTPPWSTMSPKSSAITPEAQAEDLRQQINNSCSGK